MNVFVKETLHKFSEFIVRIFSPFNCSYESKKRLLGVISVIFVFVLLCISVTFIQQAVTGASGKEFWDDETFGFNAVKTYKWSYLLIHGVPGQGSAAPLDYLLLKFYYHLRPHVQSFGLNFNAYYRLNSIFCNLISIFAIVSFLFFQIRKSITNLLVFGAQSLILILAFIIYLFWPQNFYFSTEMRPYALWSSLWLLSLVLFMYKKELTWPLTVLLILLSATATASSFQLASFAAGFVIVKLLCKEEFLGTVKKVLKIFTLPMIVSLLYIIGQPHNWSFGHYEDHLRNFYKFWTTKEMIPILSVLGLLMAFKFKKFQSHVIIFSTTLILYLISPIINHIIISKGVFFSSRHYLYYELIYPLFLINLSLILPEYLERLRNYSLVKT